MAEPVELTGDMMLARIGKLLLEVEARGAREDAYKARIAELEAELAVFTGTSKIKG